MAVESAQVQIKLNYDADEGVLQISIEQARNLLALAFPNNAQVWVCLMCSSFLKGHSWDRLTDNV